MNYRSTRTIVNDINSNLFKFYEMFRDNHADYIIDRIIKNINTFWLLRRGVKQKSEEAEIYKPRYMKMREYANQTKDWIDIYSCMFYAFSQQMRFNSKGEFNMPFGNGAFTEQNEQYIRDGCAFFHRGSVITTNFDFRELKVDKLNPMDFVYLDPPYFNTTATYNENNGWSMQDDLDLFKLCEQLDARHIRFGMSNVFKCKGKENTHLIEWCEKCGWRVYIFDNFTYMACGKGNSEAKEVFICNY
ncbi:DNA adenine methylase [Ruminococcus sp. YE282]|nr:DNA adenine methylase [Ruminococcus bromii]